MMKKKDKVMEKDNSEEKSFSIKSLIPYVIILVVVVLFRTFIATPIIVDGDSMDPTLKDGEMMLLYKLAKIDYGDIVVINNKEGYIIKRVIAMPGDTISCLDHIIYRNGEAIEDDFSNVTDDFAEVKLSTGQYFVMGDNRQISLDSRIFGVVHEKEILGTTNFALYPFSKFGRVNK